MNSVEEKKLKIRYRKFSYAAWITGFSTLTLLLFLKHGDALSLIHCGTVTTPLALYFIGFYLALLLFSLAVSYSFKQGKRKWIIANALLMTVVFLSLYLFSMEIPFEDRSGTLREITLRFPRYTAAGAAFNGFYLALKALLKREEN